MAKKYSTLALFCAAAIIFSYVEILIPLPVPIPFFKLGLSNIAILSALYFFSLKETVMIAAARTIVVALLFGSVVSLIFSLIGSTLSLSVMYPLKKCGKFSIFGVSVGGATAHNIGQCAAAAILVGSKPILFYFPFLMVCAVVTGMFVGAVSGIVINRLKYLKFQ